MAGRLGDTRASASIWSPCTSPRSVSEYSRNGTSSTSAMTVLITLRTILSCSRLPSIDGCSASPPRRCPLPRSSVAIWRMRSTRSSRSTRASRVVVCRECSTPSKPPTDGRRAQRPSVATKQLSESSTMEREATRSTYQKKERAYSSSAHVLAAQSSRKNSMTEKEVQPKGLSYETSMSVATRKSSMKSAQNVMPMKKSSVTGWSMPC
eukprot:scaffold13643_cov110-Isochrysis_galbana.AAC.8